MLGAAAIAQVSSEDDQVFRELSRSKASARDASLAADRAVASGGDHATLKVIENKDIPIAYLPGSALRVRVVGDVAVCASTRALWPRVTGTSQRTPMTSSRYAICSVCCNDRRCASVQPRTRDHRRQL